jgi:hypothetical protein
MRFRKVFLEELVAGMAIGCWLAWLGWSDYEIQFVVLASSSGVYF